jgi:hypothetical protein
MNIKRRTDRYTGWLMFGLLLLLSVSACKKDDPTKAVVTVLDINKVPIAGATVTLWQDTAVNVVNGVQSNIRVSKISDAAGTAEFEFKLEAFLNVEVIFNSDTGRSFIRLKEHETVSATVNM